MHERPPCIAAADHREATAQHLPDDRPVEQAGAFAVERAISQHQAFHIEGSGDRCLQMPDGLEAPAKLFGRLRVEGIRLRFDRAAGPARRPAAIALRDKPPDAGCARCRHQMIGALRPQAIAHGEEAVELPQIRRALQVRHLVHDHVGLCCRHRGADGLAVEAVGHRGLGAKLPDRFGLLWGVRQPHHRMASGGETGDQVLSYGPGGAGQKNPHDKRLLPVAPSGMAGEFVRRGRMKTTGRLDRAIAIETPCMP